MKKVELTIDRLTFGGRGVGRHEGMAVFVPGVMPGEQVVARLTRVKKRFAEAELEQVLVPSPQRIAPLCPVFDRCGGCQWQYLSYTDQLHQKQTIFTEMLQRQASIAPEVIDEVVPSSDEWGYRSRAQLKVEWGKGGARIGFYETRSHRPVPFEQCPVLHPHLNDLLTSVKQSPLLSSLSESLYRIDLQLDDEGLRRLVLFCDTTTLKPLVEPLEQLAAQTGCRLCLMNRQNQLRWSSEDDMRLFIRPQGEGGLRLGYGPQGFAQINLLQNRRMVSQVVDMMVRYQRKQVLDLYCGMGNFTLPLAKAGVCCTGVELAEESVAQGQENARLNRLENVNFMAGSVANEARSLLAGQKFDAVLLDPPREGAFDVVPILLENKVPFLVYVSCDPATLARDLKGLVAGGYRVVSSRPYDLFPQTWHLESLTLLEWKPV